MAELTVDLFADGSIRATHEMAGIGGWLCPSAQQDIKLFEYSRVIPYVHSINSIEYDAVIYGVGWAIASGFRRINIFSDSNIVVQQVTGEYTCNKDHLRQKRDELRRLLNSMSSWTIQHIPREENKHADMLAGAATERRDALIKYGHYINGTLRP